MCQWADAKSSLTSSLGGLRATVFDVKRIQSIAPSVSSRQGVFDRIIALRIVRSLRIQAVRAVRASLLGLPAAISGERRFVTARALKHDERWAELLKAIDGRPVAVG